MQTFRRGISTKLPKTTKGNRPLESAIQLSICDYLKLKQWFFWRQNTVGMYDAKRETFRSLPKYARHGVSDILLVKDGILYALEVKRKGGKQSERQKEFQKDLEAAGGKYFLVESIEDVQVIGL